VLIDATNGYHLSCQKMAGVGKVNVLVARVFSNGILLGVLRLGSTRESRSVSTTKLIVQQRNGVRLQLLHSDDR